MKAITAEQLVSIMNSPFAQISYSQEGEDLVIGRLLGGKSNGFYVDVGAHHPYRFSNSFIFYLKGWRGINIDATPGSMGLFHKHRPRDINIEAFVSDRTEPVSFDLYDEPALNTADAGRRDLLTAYKLMDTIKVQPRRLDAILDETMPAGTRIDFLSIDAEGADLEVLRSMDLDRYRPHMIILEDKTLDLAQLDQSPVFHHMTRYGYRFLSKLVSSSIWIEGAAS